MVNIAPACPSCNEPLKAGSSWIGANYCRGLFLLKAVAVTPGLSAWELSEHTGMVYKDVSNGLQKLREWDIVLTKAEERDQGGVRYRYYPAPDAPQRSAFEEAARSAEAKERSRIENARRLT
jgi:DNA-binding transcriptional regulator GbsR (MarR family)